MNKRRSGCILDRSCWRGLVECEGRIQGSTLVGDGVAKQLDLEG